MSTHRSSSSSSSKSRNKWARRGGKSILGWVSSALRMIWRCSTIGFLRSWVLNFSSILLNTSWESTTCPTILSSFLSTSTSSSSSSSSTKCASPATWRDKSKKRFSTSHRSLTGLIASRRPSARVKWTTMSSHISMNSDTSSRRGLFLGISMTSYAA